MVLAQETDRWDQIEDPHINLHIYGHLTLDKEAEILEKRQHLHHMVLVKLNGCI